MLHWCGEQRCWTCLSRCSALLASRLLQCTARAGPTRWQPKTRTQMTNIALVSELVVTLARACPYTFAGGVAGALAPIRQVHKPTAKVVQLSCDVWYVAQHVVTIAQPSTAPHSTLDGHFGGGQGLGASKGGCQVEERGLRDRACNRVLLLSWRSWCAPFSRT